MGYSVKQVTLSFIRKQAEELREKTQVFFHSFQTQQLSLNLTNASYNTEQEGGRQLSLKP